MINCGIGPRLVYDGSQTIAMLSPTKVFSSDRLEMAVAGIRIVLLHAPAGETDLACVMLEMRGALRQKD